MLAAALFVGFAGSSAQALPLLGLEAGGIVGLNVGEHIRDININFNKSDLAYASYLSYGAYARLWIKTPLRIAPFIKWEDVATKGIAAEERFNNVQYGGVVGIPLLGIITPYIGGSYSTFTRQYENTWAFNYGVHITFPIVPIAFGIDGSFQRPKTEGHKVDLHRIGVTLALQF
ncbi:hypothetical protein CQA66_03375 [Helicobacter aurati]|uniref:Outer membrane beta-barrel protein n=1 Tax=Helicobacter aurati TaxID=137778 RepID=A0A3D8J6Z4_9HELI|nr:hypothetical protein CQA66_03375 [Helicobacter aurati]